MYRFGLDWISFHCGIQSLIQSNKKNWFFLFFRFVRFSVIRFGRHSLYWIESIINVLTQFYISKLFSLEQCYCLRRNHCTNCDKKKPLTNEIISLSRKTIPIWIDKQIKMSQVVFVVLRVTVFHLFWSNATSVFH